MKMARTTTAAAAIGAATHEAHTPRESPSAPPFLRAPIPPPWAAVPAAEPSIASPWSPMAEQPRASPGMSVDGGLSPSPMPQKTTVRDVEEQEVEERQREEREEGQREEGVRQRKEAKRLRGGCIPCPNGSVCYIIPIPCCCF